MTLLAIAFLATAFFYASVGFGGGSTYLALLVLAGVSMQFVPIIAPLCNIVVVLGGSVRYACAHLVPWQRVLPLVAASAPMAYLGGLTPIGERAFIAILGTSLLVAGSLLILQPTRFRSERRVEPDPRVDAALGGTIGYLSGLVGIGGGIFLSPVQHLIGWASARQIAATASVFILANAVAGLGGQLSKLGLSGLPTVLAFWPLALAVLIGGQLGTHAGLRLFPEPVIRRTTGILVLFVAGQLLWRVFAG